MTIVWLNKTYSPSLDDFSLANVVDQMCVPDRAGIIREM